MYSSIGNNTGTTDGHLRTNEWTDTTSHRDAQSHLKIDQLCFSFVILFFHPDKNSDITLNSAKSPYIEYKS